MTDPPCRLTRALCLALIAICDTHGYPHLVSELEAIRGQLPPDEETPDGMVQGR